MNFTTAYIKTKRYVVENNIIIAIDKNNKREFRTPLNEPQIPQEEEERNEKHSN